MRHFIDDDQGYLSWIANHPEAFVLNLPHAPGGTIVFHRSRCRSISTPVRSHYTDHEYTKLCITNVAELVAWVAGQARTLKPCGQCQPERTSGAVTSDHSRVASSPAGYTVGSGAMPAREREQGSEVAGAALGMPVLPLWERGRIIRQVDGISPLLASWEAVLHPSQQRMRAYLAEITEALGPLPDQPPMLFLHMDIAVNEPIALLRHHDLENYLTPVAAHLGGARFVLATGAKRLGGTSHISIGEAVPNRSAPDASWTTFTWHSEDAAGTPAWKANLRAALLATHPQVLPAGPVEAQIAWRCASRRAWVNLWKPTGDAMGPVLGEPQQAHPFNPADDRIVMLQLHRILDNTLGHAMAVGLWWRCHTPSQGMDA